MNASRDRGAVAVEFALIVPLFVIFLLGLIEGGTRYAQQNEVEHWAFVVARDLSIDPTLSAQAQVNTLKGSDTTSYSASKSGSCSAPGGQVTVTVTATRASMSGLFGTYTLTGKGVARCEA